MLRMRWRICPISMTQSIKGHANCSYPGVLLYVTTISVLICNPNSYSYSRLTRIHYWWCNHFNRTL